jgi:glycosyltransferase involved in cell wall biosynthesis
MAGEDIAPAGAWDRRLRIALVAACPFPAARGTPVRIEQMADALVARGHRVDVVTYHLGADCADRAFTVHRIANVRGYRRTVPGPSWRKLLQIDPMLTSKVLERSRHGGYDIIHAHHVEGLLAALPASRRFGIPLVYDVHTLLETELPYYRLGLGRELLRRIGKIADRSLPRLADHVVAVSATIGEAVRRDARIAADRIDVIPNGVEKPFFDAEPTTAAGAPSLTYAGNLAAYQGIELLLRAFAHARVRRPDLRLKILSDDRFDAYETLAAALGVRDAIEVRAVPLAELPARLAHADVVANPRVDCAGLPQKLVNYMAAGCPIVSYRGSAKHVVHGATALIVEDNDVEGLGEAALRLIEDRPLARRLGSAARRYAKAELDWARTAERIETVYFGLLSRGRR